jgi:hypothetical protein
MDGKFWVLGKGLGRVGEKGHFSCTEYSIRNSNFI